MTTTHKSRSRPAEILREYGPYPGISHIHGVTFDGARVWVATGPKLIAFDPESGQPTRTLDRAGDAAGGAGGFGQERRLGRGAGDVGGELVHLAHVLV